MPDLDKLEQFNEELIKIGDEPAIAQKRGEEIERVLTPAEYPMDHNGGSGFKTNSTKNADKPAAAAPAGPSTDDFLSQLDPDLFSGAAGTAAAAPAGGGLDDLFDSDILSGAPALPEVAETSPANNYDDLFGDSPAVPAAGESAPDDFGLDDLLGTTGSAEADEAAAGPAPAGAGDAGDADFGLGDLDFGGSAEPADAGLPEDDTSPSFDLGDFGGLDGGDEPAAPAAPADADAFGDLGDFGAGDFAPAEPDGAGPSDAGMGDLDLGGVGDEPFDFGDAGSGEPIGEAPAADEAGDFAAMDNIPDFATDMSSEFGTDDFADEFNMGDFGKDFGVMEEVHEEAAAGEPKHSVMEEVDEVIAKANAADEADAFDLSPEDFRYIQESLGAMPRNLKIAVEEAVGSPDYTFDVIHPLINALIKGESPKDIASLLARVTGKRIKIPAGYTRKTGEAFAAEQRSFAYQFRENFLPVLRLVAMVAVAVGFLAYAAYQWVYRPLYGNSLYDQGLEAIRHEEYVQGNGLFEKAYGVWPDNDRYLQYGLAFREMKQWGYARAKYEELLGMPEAKDKPRGKDRMHRAGILAFADFSAYTLRDYGNAVNYLDRLVAVNRLDHVPVLMQGDIYIEWARYTAPGDKVHADQLVRRLLLAAWPEKGRDEDEILTGPAALYNAARFNYASLTKKEGQTDALLSRMLRYFMRLGQYYEEQAVLAGDTARKAQSQGEYTVQEKQEALLRAANRRVAELETEAEKIKKVFLTDKKSAPDPAVIAELAGLLIDKAEGQVKFMEDAFSLLMKAEKGPEGEREAALHYQLARYYRALHNKQNELETLKWSEFYLNERLRLRPLDRFELMQMIDTLIRQGEIAWGSVYNGKDAINAQRKFENARDLYENSLQTRMIRQRSSLFGRVYAWLGDLKYYEASDYETALRQYRLARQNQYGLPPGDLELAQPRLTIEELTKAAQDMSYKAGFIWYTLANREPEDSAAKGGLYTEAARELVASQGPIPLGNDNLDWAVANTSYLRCNYELAATLYRNLADRVEMERRRLSPQIAEEDFRQRSMVEFLIRINNNLGVSLYNLSRQGGRAGSQYLAQAQYHVSRATELYQSISHEPLADSFNDMKLQPGHFGLPLLNMKSMINPAKADVVEIFREIRKDLTGTDFGPALTEGGPGQ